MAAALSPPLSEHRISYSSRPGRYMNDYACWPHLRRESGVIFISCSQLFELVYKVRNDWFIIWMYLISRPFKKALHFIRVFITIEQLPFIDSVVADQFVPLGPYSVVRRDPSYPAYQVRDSILRILDALPSPWSSRCCNRALVADILIFALTCYACVSHFSGKSARHGLLPQ